MAPKTAGSALCTVSGRAQWLEAKEFEALDFKTWPQMRKKLLRDLAVS